MIRRYFCFAISSPTPCAEFPQETFNRFNNLSRREWEVLSVFCSGKDYHEVAKALFISDSTVRTHLKTSIGSWKWIISGPCSVCSTNMNKPSRYKDNGFSEKHFRNVALRKCFLWLQARRLSPAGSAPNSHLLCGGNQLLAEIRMRHRDDPLRSFPSRGPFKFTFPYSVTSQWRLQRVSVTADPGSKMGRIRLFISPVSLF